MMDLSPEQFALARRIFLSVRGLAAGAREQAIRDGAGGDEVVAAHVRALLRHDVEDGLSAAENEDGPRLGVPLNIGAMVHAAGSGAEIGAYRVVRLLARGGQGEVYEAQQRNPERRVALKVLSRIAPSSGSPAFLRRFEREAEVLAQLRHPNIAQVYEAGYTPGLDGTPIPFFAMEYIDGHPLLRHATESGLGFRERLDLFLQVCDAVQHAHQQGVIHRDLKPDNILVESDGKVKVIDFGVARLVDPPTGVGLATIQTLPGELIGTLRYMAPEQAESGMAGSSSAAGPSTGVDTRVDVYALGVILYELLADRPPYLLSDKALPEAVRIIREDQPTRLSTINPACKGDLDAIVATALAKDRTRRFQSVQELAADVRRFLNGDPVTARPPTAGYYLKRLARRHRVAMIAGIAVSVSVLVAVFSIFVARQESHSKRQILEIWFPAANELSNKLGNSGSPESMRHAALIFKTSYQMMEALDQSDTPTATSALKSWSVLLERLEDHSPEALAVMRRAWELKRQHDGALEVETLGCLRIFADGLRAAGDVEQAVARYTDLVQLLRELKNVGELRRTLGKLAEIAESRGDEAAAAKYRAETAAVE